MKNRARWSGGFIAFLAVMAGGSAIPQEARAGIPLTVQNVYTGCGAGDKAGDISTVQAPIPTCTAKFWYQIKIALSHDPNSYLASGAITVNGPNGPVQGTVSSMGVGTGYMFTTKPPQIAPGQYTVSVTAKDSLGNSLSGVSQFSFNLPGTPATPPNAAPTLTVQSVSIGIDGGNLTQIPTVQPPIPTFAGSTFNRIAVGFNIDPGSASGGVNGGLALNGPNGPVQGILTAFSGYSFITLIPQTAPGQYTISLTAKDIKGNALSGASQFSFNASALKPPPAPHTTQSSGGLIWPSGYK